MATITTYLTTEHAVFTALFDAIERILSEAETAEEVNHLARLVEDVLDHQLAQQGRLQELH